MYAQAKYLRLLDKFTAQNNYEWEFNVEEFDNSVDPKTSNILLENLQHIATKIFKF